MKNKSEIKIIFVDIDWTLFDHKSKKFVPSGLKALKKARKNGVKVIICSGRPYASIAGLHGFEKIPHDGYICTNGGLAYAEGQYVLKEPIDPKIVSGMVETANKYGITIELLKPTSACIIGKDYGTEFDCVCNFFSNWVEEKPPLANSYDGDEVTSMLLFCHQKYDKYFKKFPVYFYRFFDEGVDIYHRKYTKDIGTQAVLDFYSFSKDEAMAIGDDIPDIDMFNCVKYSIAMGNAKEECKKSAFYVTDLIHKHGLKKALKKFKVI